MHSCILPGKTIGILGGGQLGRMLCLAARSFGYRTSVYCADGPGPASQVADEFIGGAWSDHQKLTQWSQSVDVVTVEFENVPAECLEWCAAAAPVRPSPSVLRIAQDRRLEKQTLADVGIPVTPFLAVDGSDDLQRAIEAFGLPLVLKTARCGYDGKGQALVRTVEAAHTALHQLGGSALVAEKWISFEREASVLVARNPQGQIVIYPPIENTHAHHILDTSVCPIRDADTLVPRISRIAEQAAQALDLVGLLCIELFITHAGEVMLNEIAPRPHNSGHLTIEAFACDQYQQMIRAVCGLPLDSTVQLRPAAMANLLGDLWDVGTPAWDHALAIPEVSLHLYGKTEPRRGRKMGHLTATANTPQEALERVRTAQDQLRVR